VVAIMLTGPASSLGRSSPAATGVTAGAADEPVSWERATGCLGRLARLTRRTPAIVRDQAVRHVSRELDPCYRRLFIWMATTGLFPPDERGRSRAPMSLPTIGEQDIARRLVGWMKGWRAVTPTRGADRPGPVQWRGRGPAGGGDRDPALSQDVDAGRSCSSGRRKGRIPLDGTGFGWDNVVRASEEDR
jgi:hypothetical protein